MNIYIDMTTAHGSDGKVIAYYPEVHWNLDDQDSISPSAMNEIQKEVQKLLMEKLANENFRSA